MFLNIIFFSICSKNAKADGVEFVHNIKASYDIKEDKSAKIEYTFTTTNKIANNYLQTFLIRIPFDPLNIKTDGSPTPIKIGQKKKIDVKNVFEIEIEILNSVYGLNKSFSWKFSFDVNNIVLNHGLQNAIVIPNFNDEPNISRTEVNVTVPNSLGEIKYIYGNAELKKQDKNSLIYYSNDNNKSSNFIILIGNDQEYSYKVLNVSQDKEVYLPISNSYQEIIYTKIPETRNTINSFKSSKTFNLKAHEDLEATIRTSANYDKEYVKESDELSKSVLVSKISGDLKNQKIEKKDIAKKTFDILRDSFELSDFITTSNSVVDISFDKKKLTPAEVNKIFREILSSFEIENRGVYGYVFPIQPYQRENVTAEQHVWSEFWDGGKWIVVDPTWFISSKGSDYFDKNAFHHIKFGSYHNIDDIRDFLSEVNMLEISPLREKASVQKNEILEMNGYDDTFINKEIKLILSNKSNIPLKLKSITPTINLTRVKLKNTKFDLDKVLLPNSNLEISLPLEYKFIPKNIESNVKVDIEYEGSGGNISKKTFNHKVKIRSNISSYLIYFVLGLIPVLLISVPIIIFFLHKRKTHVV